MDLGASYVGARGACPTLTTGTEVFLPRDPSRTMQGNVVCLDLRPGRAPRAPTTSFSAYHYIAIASASLRY